MSDMKQPVDLEKLKTGDVIRDTGTNKPGYGDPGDDPIIDVGIKKDGYGDPGDDPVKEDDPKPR